MVSGHRLKSLPPLLVRLTFLLLWILAGSGTLASAATHEVFIENMSFKPAELEVSRGDTVTWINKDFVPHNATAEGGVFRSPDLELDQTWSYRAEQVGEFAYYCSLHPTMRANLIVVK